MGMTAGREPMVRRADILGLWDTPRGTGGRQDSMAKMPIGVDKKQFVAHLCTLCQKVLSLEREPALGV